MSLRKTFFFFCLLIFSLTVNAQTAEEVISKYLTFIGGEGKLKTINTMITSGKYNYGGMEFPFTSYSKSPNLYKYIVGSNEKYFAQAYNGSKGWKIDEFKNEKNKTILTGKSAYKMKNEADVDLENPFIDFQKKGHKAVLEGKDTVEGKECFRLKFIRSNSDTETYFFRTDNFELVKKQALSKNDELDSSLLDTFYSDYEVEDGIKIPFKAVSKVKDQTILTVTIEKVQLNVPISNNEFNP
jgi:hypothetical protein